MAGDAGRRVRDQSESEAGRAAREAREVIQDKAQSVKHKTRETIDDVKDWTKSKTGGFCLAVCRFTIKITLFIIIDFMCRCLLNTAACLTSFTQVNCFCCSCLMP